MKTGAWYVIGFVIMFTYFYVYAVNYIRGVKAAPYEPEFEDFAEFYERVKRSPVPEPLSPAVPHHPHHQMPLAASRMQSLLRPREPVAERRQLKQRPIFPR